MDRADFWQFLERSAATTSTRDARFRWLEHRLGRVGLDQVTDFQAHLETARRPIDTRGAFRAGEGSRGAR
jgi:hypothetical protein